MFPRRTKRLAELESERIERERDAGLVAHLKQSDSVSDDDGDFGAPDEFMGIFGFTRVKEPEK